MKKLLLGKAVIAAAAVVAVVGGVLVIRSATGPSNLYTAVLKTLGEAYVGDFGTKLTAVESRVTATVDGTNRAEQIALLRKALALGCVARDESFRSLPLDGVAQAFAFKMRDDKTPAEHVERIVEPGHVIVHASWRFAASPAVTSIAVFTKDGLLVFDSLLSFPAVPESVLFPRHF